MLTLNSAAETVWYIFISLGIAVILGIGMYLGNNRVTSDMTLEQRMEAVQIAVGAEQ